MKKAQIVFIFVLIAAAIAFFVYFNFDKLKTASNNFKAPSQAAKVYRSNQFGFSFEYPNGKNVSNFEDGGGEVVLVGGKVQIFIAQFGESLGPAQGKPRPITIERIKKDLPGIEMADLEKVSLAGEEGIGFKSDGKKEIWFTHAGYLYQVSAFLKDEPELIKLLSTWKF